MISRVPLLAKTQADGQTIEATAYDGGTRSVRPGIARAAHRTD